MLVAVLIFLIALVVVMAVLLFRAARRLLQFDEVLQRVAITLSDYSDDLKRMSSADIDGILVDHPEVLLFHKRNMAARNQIQGVLEEVTRETPPRRKAPALPRPDME